MCSMAHDDIANVQLLFPCQARNGPPGGIRMQLNRSLLLAFVTLIPALWAQENAGAQAVLTPAQQQRHTVHSRQVHGGIPGQIPNRLATESGDIHLDNLQGPPYYITSADPRSTLETLSCESDLVVVGKFGKATSYPTEDRDTYTVTWSSRLKKLSKTTGAHQLPQVKTSR